MVFFFFAFHLFCLIAVLHSTGTEEKEIGPLASYSNVPVGHCMFLLLSPYALKYLQGDNAGLAIISFLLKY